MDIETEPAEVAANYLSILNELTFNSKTKINELTKLAQANKGHGQVIVNTIKQQISTVRLNSIVFFDILKLKHIRI